MVTLNGNVNPLGNNVTASFEIGKTTNYEHKIDCGVVEGFQPIPISSQISDLEPSTLYHYRALATTSTNITIHGDDMTFTTPEETIPTITIGTQVWMKKNLNVGVMIPITTKQTNNGIIEKYCYGNLESNGDIYGGLYSWDEMMGYSKVPGCQGICPDGFRIPTREDWNILSSFAGVDVGYKLREVGNVHWKYVSNGTNGTDIYGFTGLPSGYGTKTFGNLQMYGYFWSSTLSPEGWAYYRSLNYSASSFYEYQAYITGQGAIYLPVRCIKI